MRRYCGALTRPMTSKLTSYLHVRRRQWRLSQKELAFLLGYRTDSIISRYEHRERRMTLAIAFACSLIFGVEAKDMFPKLFEEVEDGVVRRLYELYNRLKAGKPSKKKDAKLRLLEEALSRTTTRARHEEV
jgi:transcriptional regulator with XRE-family HTH domain